jgi:hypothetical protein
MSVDRYSNRRHRLTAMVAQLRASLATPAKPRARAAAAKTRPSVSAAAARNRRLRLAEAECAVNPAPRRKPSPPLAPEACTSLTVGGSLFDRTPTVYAVDGGAAPTGAAKRLNVQATHQQRLQRLARAESDMRR